MDLRAYYQQIREEEASLSRPSAVIVSIATADGGAEGVVTEAPTSIAARMIVQKRARRATHDEAMKFQERQDALRKAAEENAAASRLQVVVVPANNASGKGQRTGKEL